MSDSPKSSSLDKLNIFLNKHYVSKNAEHQNLTHTAFCPGPNSGRYSISQNVYDEFLNLYHDAIYHGNQLNLIEKCDNLKYSPLRIDIDFRFDEEITEHAYNVDDLKTIIKSYYYVIEKYLDLSKEETQVFVYEIKSPITDTNKTSTIYKDGIHILFPKINITPDIQHIIRNNILEIFGNIFDTVKLKFINPPGDVIDLSIIDRNGWIMYGSSKPNREPYKLTKSYLFNTDCEDEDLVLEEVDINILTLKQIIEMSSIRNKSTTVKIKEDKVKEIKEYNEKKLIEKKKKVNKSCAKDSADIKHVKELLEMLKTERFDNYNDWLDIGIVLFNINNEDESYLYLWDEMSSKSSKYESTACKKKWDSFTSRGDTDEQLNIGTLMFWAQIDNPDEYMKFTFRNEKKKAFIEKCLKLPPLDSDLAEVINLLYDKHFKYDEIAKVWYQFVEHHWEMVGSEPLDLSKFISRDVFIFFKEYVLKNAYNNTNDMENFAKMMEDTAKTLDAISKKLKNSSPKQHIIKECKNYFKDKTFKDLLNENEYLIGFKDGVYDLKNKLFRNGRPSDYITLCVGYEYIEYDENNSIIKEIENFINSIQPDITQDDLDRRLYLKKFLASCLEGGNIDETFVIFTGSGRNGKSKLIELMEKAMGDYAGKISVSCITRPRNKSSDASPDIISLKSKRFVSMVESDQRENINNGILKEITGGDIISGRGLYKETEEFKPQFKFVLACNDIPGLQTPDDPAFYERLRICDFPAHFTKKVENEYDKEIDETITKKIKSWAPYFMSILIHWYHEFFPKGQNKIKPPDCVISHNNIYRTNNDEWNDFFTISCKIIKTNKNTDKVKIKPIYDEFRHWYQDNCGNKQLPDLKTFRTYLIKRYKIKQTTVKNNTLTGYIVEFIKE